MIVKDTPTRELIKPGVYPAICERLIGIGHQEPPPGSPYGPKNQIIIAWELPTVRRIFDEEKGEESSMMSKFFSLSLHEKSNLRAILEGWRSRPFTPAELAGFELKNLLGVGCSLVVQHKANSKGEMKDIIGNVLPLPKEEWPKPEREPLYYDIFAPDENVFAQLPEWIQGLITRSSDWQKENNPVNAADLEPNDLVEDEIPF